MCYVVCFVWPFARKLVSPSPALGWSQSKFEPRLGGRAVCRHGRCTYLPASSDCTESANGSTTLHVAASPPPPGTFKDAHRGHCQHRIHGQCKCKQTQQFMWTPLHQRHHPSYSESQHIKHHACTVSASTGSATTIISYHANLTKASAIVVGTAPRYVEQARPNQPG